MVELMLKEESKLYKLKPEKLETFMRKDLPNIKPRSINRKKYNKEWIVQEETWSKEGITLSVGNNFTPLFLNNKVSITRINLNQDNGCKKKIKENHYNKELIINKLFHLVEKWMLTTWHTKKERHYNLRRITKQQLTDITAKLVKIGHVFKEKMGNEVH